MAESETAPRDRPFDASWKVSLGLRAYLNENGFTHEEYDAPSVLVSVLGLNVRVPNPPSRKISIRFHDLHHVATGFGTDLVGEAEISAWEVRRGIRVFPGVYVKCIVFSLAFLGLFYCPRRTLRAWRLGKRSKPLITTSPERYAELLEMSIGELRELYGVPSDGIGGARELHSGAPAAA